MKTLKILKSLGIFILLLLALSGIVLVSGVFLPTYVAYGVWLIAVMGFYQVVDEKIVKQYKWE